MIKAISSTLRKRRIFSELEKAVVGKSMRVERSEWTWFLRFGQEATLAVESLWRLVGTNCISVTSEDDGQQFGLPAPVNACDKANGLIADSIVASVELVGPSGDLLFRFSNKMALEILTTSMGYESWQMYHHDELIAVGANGGII